MTTTHQQSSRPTGPTSCSLYVGDLPTNLPNPEDLLFNLFSKAGLVMSIKVCRDMNTQRSLGYAYVNFQNPQDAENALQRLNFQEIQPGRPIRVMWSVRDPQVRKNPMGNVFVKNLDPSIDNKTLHDTFAVFGSIFSCKIATGEDGKSLGYGFVHFEKDESAQEAIKRVDGMTIGSKEVQVMPFIKKTDRDAKDAQVFTNVYIKNLKPNVTEEQVTKLLEPFGTAESIYLGEAGQYKTKFALIAMAEHESAVGMIDKLNGTEHDLAEEGQKLYVARALKKRDRIVARSRASANNLYQSQGRNLYVKHIDDNMTIEDFKALFAPFGEITSATLMKDNDGNLRGFGFVCFAQKEAAQAAIREMNTKMVGRRPLYVSQAQQKDMRHHLLEEQRKNIAQHHQRIQMMGGGGFGGAGWDGPGRGGFGMGGMGRGGFAGGRGGAMGPMSFNMNGYQMPMMPGRGRGVGPNRGMMPGFPPQMPFMQQGPPRMGAGYTQPMPSMMMPQQSRPRTLPGSNLTSADLGKLGPDEQKNALGEKLYVQVAELTDMSKAPKITGMLLEMDTAEILNVLEDRQMLSIKVNEAISVLQRHEKY